MALQPCSCAQYPRRSRSKGDLGPQKVGIYADFDTLHLWYRRMRTPFIFFRPEAADVGQGVSASCIDGQLGSLFGSRCDQKPRRRQEKARRGWGRISIRQAGEPDSTDLSNPDPVSCKPNQYTAPVLYFPTGHRFRAASNRTINKLTNGVIMRGLWSVTSFPYLTPSLD